jgi:hypothetical protein
MHAVKHLQKNIGIMNKHAVELCDRMGKHLLYFALVSREIIKEIPYWYTGAKLE